MRAALPVQAPTWEFPVSIGFHGLLFLVLMLARCESTHAPLIPDQEIIMVELPGPARQTTAMPQKAERAPPPPSGVQEAPPPPPNQSELAIQTPEAPKEQGVPKEDPREKAKREALLNELRRQQMIQDLNAPVGEENRAATSPDGNTDEGSTGSGASENEKSKWAAEATKIVRANWHPLLSICQADPKLNVTIRVTVDGQGNQIKEPTVEKTSNNESLDGSALRAVEQSGKLPPTPDPNGWAFGLRFNCKDVL
jgi:TonB family protein